MSHLQESVNENEHRQDVVERVKDEFPTMTGVLDGRVSGRLSEWPDLAREIHSALEHVAAIQLKVATCPKCGRREVGG